MRQPKDPKEGYKLGLDWPRCYHEGEHEAFKFDRNCDHCHLSNIHHDPPQLAVGITAPDDLRDVRLIVISDYPGTYEERLGFCMVDNQLLRSAPAEMNAGASIRYLLEDMFGLDTYEQVLWTNAVRCLRGEKEVVKRDISVCVDRWLKNDFDLIDLYIPQVPVLLAGTQAFRILPFVDPNRWRGVKADLASSRRKVNYLRDHPCVTTYNPAAFGRSRPHQELGLRKLKRGYRATSVYAFPCLPGTFEWHMRRDLEYLRPLLQPESNHAPSNQTRMG